MIRGHPAKSKELGIDLATCQYKQLAKDIGNYFLEMGKGTVQYIFLLSYPVRVQAGEITK